MSAAPAAKARTAPAVWERRAATAEMAPEEEEKLIAQCTFKATSLPHAFAHVGDYLLVGWILVIAATVGSSAYENGVTTFTMLTYWSIVAEGVFFVLELGSRSLVVLVLKKGPLRSFTARLNDMLVLFGFWFVYAQTFAVALGVTVLISSDPDLYYRSVAEMGEARARFGNILIHYIPVAVMMCVYAPVHRSRMVALEMKLNAVFDHLPQGPWALAAVNMARFVLSPVFSSVYALVFDYRESYNTSASFYALFMSIMFGGMVGSLFVLLDLRGAMHVARREAKALVTGGLVRNEPRRGATYTRVVTDQA